MMVCIVLKWFLLTVLQESSNLDAIFSVCRKIKNLISKLVCWERINHKQISIDGIIDKREGRRELRSLNFDEREKKGIIKG